MNGGHMTNAAGYGRGTHLFPKDNGNSRKSVKQDDDVKSSF